MEKSLKIADTIVVFITGKVTPEQITILGMDWQIRRE